MEATQLAGSGEPKKPSLNELLMRLTEADDALHEFDFDTELDLLEQGKVKVDNYKYILDKLAVHSLFLQQRIEEYTKARRVVDNSIRRIEKHLVFALQNNGFSQFPGVEWQVRLQRSAPAVELKISEPSAAMKIKFPDYIRTTYAWDKTAIRDALKSGDEAASELATLRESWHARFSLLKKVE